MNTPKVSIIIPVYNVQDYLRECLDSVANQTVREIEIICVNDGSTDGSGTILDEYAAKDSRFVVVHQENAGQSVARNRGLDLARGEFVSFLDSDDYFERDMLEKALPILENPEIDIVMFFFQTFGENIEIPKDHTLSCTKLVYSEMWEKLYVVFKMTGVVWNQVYRREFLEKHKIRFLVGCLFEDTHFSAKSAYYCRNIEILPEILYHYRIGSGYTTDSRRNASLCRMPEMYKYLLEDFRCSGLEAEIIEYFLSYYYNSLRRLYRKLILPEEKLEYREKILAELTPTDWEQIGGENRFVPSRVRFFFFWLQGKPIRACWQFVKPLWRRNWTLKKMVELKCKSVNIK